jgi:hypothetical protein
MVFSREMERKKDILSCKEAPPSSQQLITGRWADDLKTPFLCYQYLYTLD